MENLKDLPLQPKTLPPMHIVMFYHSVISDWNNGNAHFLRGLVRELTQLGHHVVVYEPRHGWSISNLEQERSNVEEEFFRYFPDVKVVRYNPPLLRLEEVLDTADVVIVHEWTEHDLVKAISDHRGRHPHYQLLFHDTHHRMVSEPEAMQKYDLSNYDGVLAFGSRIRDLYLERGWADNVWVFHEAADTQLFYPRDPVEPRKDLLWIGNWGDEERTAELHDYYINPVRELQLTSTAYGVRYPRQALATLHEANIDYRGMLPNYLVPETTSHFRAMIHIPRRPYVEALPGIPTIRPFEAMACGIPLVSAYWNDFENLFTEGKDYLLARNPREMRENIRTILSDPIFARELTQHALQTIHRKHTCAHRAGQLLDIINELHHSSTEVEAVCSGNQQ